VGRHENKGECRRQYSEYSRNPMSNIRLSCFDDGVFFCLLLAPLNALVDPFNRGLLFSVFFARSLKPGCQSGRKTTDHGLRTTGDKFMVFRRAETYPVRGGQRWWRLGRGPQVFSYARHQESGITPDSLNRDTRSGQWSREQSSPLPG
jgi:hypothetical protein